MRACQKCATPIPTAAKICEHCHAEQKATVGLRCDTSPETLDVAEEMQFRDQEVGRVALMALVTGSILAALVTGFSLSNFAVGAGVFFIALGSLLIAIQSMGIDVGM